MFKEDLIWMSYRYCIGRHTIAAAQHAPNIVKYGLDYIPINRREFTARDIRMQINDKISWYNNIYREEYEHNYDIVSCIIKYMIDNKIEGDLEHFYLTHYWNVNVKTGKVKVTGYNQKDPTEFDTFSSIFHEYHDYEPWIKLANFLDTKQHEKITVDFKGVKDIMCFKHYCINYKNNVTMHYIGIDSYMNNPYINQYIDPQYIIKNE